MVAAGKGTNQGEQTARLSPWEAMHIKWGDWDTGPITGQENQEIKQREYLVLRKTYCEMFRERTKDMEKEGSSWICEG